MQTVSITLKDLVDHNPNKVTNLRGGNCILYFIEYTQSTDRYVFLIKCKESYSSDTGHLVSLKFEQQAKHLPLADEMLVNCSCPYFLYYGVAYNLTQSEDILDMNEERAPDIRDKERKNKICKHIATVKTNLRGLTYNKLQKKSDIRAFSVAPEFQTVSIKGCVPAIISYLERNRTDIDPLSFTSSLTKENFEEQLLAIGMIK